MTEESNQVRQTSLWCFCRRHVMAEETTIVQDSRGFFHTLRTCSERVSDA